ncbi:WD40 repeat-like protein [Gonapodya prolifera JEL478]|uniref:WD40 repeat-like protein n=1 Tax=Gonapodya prolifera (strain JEL478) TaxID=1344416 RepID=A0A139AMP8_GONPJ|nr:WD40 repeat-like protein [Gonapodya prolifera JEL478]|eukprot:KXS18040.1 WD40 repeat-like protein [Gonapodya prolifera JEL478]
MQKSLTDGFFAAWAPPSTHGSSSNLHRPTADATLSHHNSLPRLKVSTEGGREGTSAHADDSPRGSHHAPPVSPGVAKKNSGFHLSLSISALSGKDSPKSPRSPKPVHQSQEITIQSSPTESSQPDTYDFSTRIAQTGGGGASTVHAYAEDDPFSFPMMFGDVSKPAVDEAAAQEAAKKIDEAKKVAKEEQEVGDGTSSSKGAIWSMQFSSDGRYLATGGEDTHVRVWSAMTESAHEGLDDDSSSSAPSLVGSTAGSSGVASKLMANGVTKAIRRRSILPGIIGEEFAAPDPKSRNTSRASSPTTSASGSLDSNNRQAKLLQVFQSKPHRVYRGHTSDILDISFSGNDFLLSSSLDATVRLWHIADDSCLGIFRHPDAVPSVSFHPNDDKWFVSGCFDGKVRVWNLNTKACVATERLRGSGREVAADVAGNSKGKFSGVLPSRPPHLLCTAVGISADGGMVIAGSMDGRLTFYEFQGLRYHTQIELAAPGKGSKISGITAYPSTGILNDGESPLSRELPPPSYVTRDPSGKILVVERNRTGKILVTSNDQRLRLMSLSDKSIVRKYHGAKNVQSQVKASVAGPHAEWIVGGSDDGRVLVWRTDPETSAVNGSMFGHRERTDRTESYESWVASDAPITSVLCAPVGLRRHLERIGLRETPDYSRTEAFGLIFVCADTKGAIRVYECFRPGDPDAVLSSDDRSTHSVNVG